LRSAVRLAWLLAVLASIAAGCRIASNPKTVHEHITQTIRSGDYKTAMSEVDSALLEYGKKSPEWSWRFRILKAFILDSQSVPAEALAILHEDVPSSLTTSDIPVRKAMLEGMAFRVAQDFKQSDEKLAIAEELANSNQPQILCEVLNFKGALLVDEEKYQEAEATYDRALKLARENGRKDQEASAQVALAWVATKRERFDQGVERGQAALSLARSLNMQGLVAAALGNLGWNYSELGDFDNALEFYKEGAQRSEQSDLKGLAPYWFTGVANSYLALHDYNSAAELSKRTLERARALKNAQTMTECLNTLAEVTLRTGRLEEAERYNQEAVKLEQAGADHFGVLDSIVLSGRIEAKKGHFAEAEKLFRRVLNDREAETAVRWSVQARLAELDDAKGLPIQAEQEYRKSIQTFEAARSSIGADDLRLSFLSGAIEFYDDFVNFLIRRGRSDDALTVAELGRAQTLEEGLATGNEAAAAVSRSVRPRELARRLNSTLLFYWVGEDHSYLWVITPANTTCLVLQPASEIDPVVKSYREALLGGRDPLETGNREGEKLYEILIAPAKNLVPQDSRVILLPDGSLYGLNFETLIVPNPKPHYWIEDVTVTTASSLTLLASAAARPLPKEKNMFLVGDTVSPNADFPALPQARAEMQNIEKYFPEQHRAVLSGSEATPAAYLAGKPEQFAYLHFVTHGTASRARPLESAVVLSKEKGEDSYKLYARDIVKRRLSAYLVTISACNGAGTRAFSGEGLVGLSWAFLRAGAHNVVGALWEVSDASTPRLMDMLYDGLSRGQDPASALRAAKLSLLHSDNAFKKPYYWAPFQLYGGS
jgi:CHAT domain-containing protein